VPEYGDLRRALANEEIELLMIISAICPLVDADGALDMSARVSRLTVDPHESGDGACGFVTGISRLERFAACFKTYAELLTAAIKAKYKGYRGLVADRNKGTYLSEQGCGAHFDGTIDHEVVIEMWGGDICALATPQEREKAIELAERLAGPHGARVLVPDAHAALCVRRLRDVMLAHLKVWQHLSVDHPIFGRYATAVHVA